MIAIFAIHKNIVYLNKNASWFKNKKLKNIFIVFGSYANMLMEFPDESDAI